jgi:hypothetical protein
MAQRCYLRAAGHKYNMGRGKEESPRQDEVHLKKIAPSGGR